MGRLSVGGPSGLRNILQRQVVEARATGTCVATVSYPLPRKRADAPGLHACLAGKTRTLGRPARRVSFSELFGGTRLFATTEREVR